MHYSVIFLSPIHMSLIFLVLSYVYANLYPHRFCLRFTILTYFDLTTVNTYTGFAN